MNSVSSMYDPAEAEKRGAAYKLGLVQRFLRKFPFEDEQYVPNSDDEERIRKAKRFLKQVRESNGYDVDCIPAKLSSPFTPRDPVNSDAFFIEDMLIATRFAIRKINAQTGKSYELLKVEKVVHTDLSFMFLTFTVKEADAGDVDVSPTAIRALVDVPYSRKGIYELVEWMYKPESRDDVATMPTVQFCSGAEESCC